MNKIFLTSEQTIELIEEKTKALVSKAFEDFNSGIEVEKLLEDLKLMEDKFRALLEGAEYQNIDTILKLSVVECKEVGAETARLTKSIADSILNFKGNF